MTATTLPGTVYRIGPLGLRWAGNVTDNDGVIWGVSDSDAFRGPGVRLAQQAKPFGDGAFRRDSHRDALLITLTGWAECPDPQTAWRARGKLMSLFPGGGQDLLTISTPGGDYEMLVELAATPRVEFETETGINWQLVLSAVDPRWLNPLPVSASCTLPAAGDGLDWQDGATTVAGGNTGFETDTSGWTVAGGTLTRVGDQSPAGPQPHAGSGMARLVPDGVSSVVTLSSDEFAVTEGTTYSASGWAWYTAAPGANNAFVNIYYYDVGGSQVGNAFTDLDPQAQVWTQGQVSGSAPQDAVTAKVVWELWATPTAGDVWYVDDQTLPMVGGGLDWGVGSALHNGSFENDTEGWMAWGSADLAVVVDGTRGAHCVEITATQDTAPSGVVTGGTWFLVPVTGGADHVMGMDVRRVDAGAARGQVDWYAADSSFIRSDQFNPTLLSDEWEHVEFTFTAPAAAAKAQVYAAGTGMQVGDRIRIDNISLLVVDAQRGLDWGTVESDATLTLTNSGTAPAYPLMYLSGPFTGPITVRDNTTGRRLVYSQNLAGSDTVVIDTSPYVRTVTLNGVTDRRAALTTAEWFEVPPLSTVTIALLAADGGGLLGVQMREASW